MQVRARDLLLIPNILSLARIALVFLPALLIASGNPSHRPLAGAFVLLGMATDILDGYLARRLGQTSDLGRILDPLSDKLCTAILVIVLYLYSGFPLWGVALILSRDFVVLTCGLLLMRRTDVVISSNITGRIAALSWGIVIFAYAIDFRPIQIPALVTATALVAVSGVSYGVRFVSRMRG
jgi:CDP-diacylglycerol--glycerol-3-phosphate 3-phosphatidyltransferase